MKVGIFRTHTEDSEAVIEGKNIGMYTMTRSGSKERGPVLGVGK